MLLQEAQQYAAMLQAEQEAVDFIERNYRFSDQHVDSHALREPVIILHVSFCYYFASRVRVAVS